MGGGFHDTLCDGWYWFEPLKTDINGSSFAGDALGNCGNRRIEFGLNCSATGLGLKFWNWFWKWPYCADESDGNCCISIIWENMNMNCKEKIVDNL